MYYRIAIRINNWQNYISIMILVKFLERVTSRLRSQEEDKDRLCGALRNERVSHQQ
jgi:hypothetical protein